MTATRDENRAIDHDVSVEVALDRIAELANELGSERVREEAAGLGCLADHRGPDRRAAWAYEKRAGSLSRRNVGGYRP